MSGNKIQQPSLRVQSGSSVGQQHVPNPGIRMERFAGQSNQAFFNTLDAGVCVFAACACVILYKCWLRNYSRLFRRQEIKLKFRTARGQSTNKPLACRWKCIICRRAGEINKSAVVEARTSNTQPPWPVYSDWRRFRLHYPRSQYVCVHLWGRGRGAHNMLV